MLVSSIGACWKYFTKSLDAAAAKGRLLRAWWWPLSEKEHRLLRKSCLLLKVPYFQHCHLSFLRGSKGKIESSLYIVACLSRLPSARSSFLLTLSTDECQEAMSRKPSLLPLASHIATSPWIFNCLLKVAAQSIVASRRCASEEVFAKEDRGQ